ncbi:hypothetical protein NFI96_005927 [Prochilodus magdalenae]|nr:hypothetical protein NFI96_005927 [Prochilodus magdalenae]
MKCFGCGREGHLRRSCPSGAGEGTSRASDSAPAGGSAAGVDPEPGQEPVLGPEPVSGAVGTEMGLGAAHVGVNDSSDTQSQATEGGEVAEPVVANSSTIDIGDALQEGSGSQGDGVTVAGTGVDAVALAESILEGEGMEMDALAEETLFKVPSGKRKMRRTKVVGKKGQAQRAGGAQGKKHEMNPGSGSGLLDDSDSDLPDAKSRRSQRSAYAFDKIRARSMARLEDEILELQSLVDSTRDQGHVRALKLKTSALGDLLGIRAQGALVRSRFQKLTQMDAPSRFFFSLERKNGQSRFIHSLCSEDGRELTEPTGIRKRAVRFYAELYRSEFRDDEDLAAGFYAGLPKVSERSNGLLERPLGVQELHAALQGMDGGTAPGIDGLPVEFYKTFWTELGADLLAVLNESLAVGSLPLSCRRAVITLLPKKGNLQDIRNWRPAILVDFFWDRLHWVQKGVLFLPREGGPGLVHLASRLATFRLQFVQKFLTGSTDLVWRGVACTILRRIDGLGLDTGLFLMDYKQLHLSGVSPFYRGLFKVWGLFKSRRMEDSTSLFWLLEEPLIKGARLDVAGDDAPGLTRVLCASRTVKLQNLVDVSGPGLDDIQAVASLLGQRSLRHTETILVSWKDRLTSDELSLLQDYGTGSAVPNREDPFPKTALTPALDDVSGPLFDLSGLQYLDLHTVSGRVFYKCCVKVLNKAVLHGRPDTVWRDKLGVEMDRRPVWRVLYKPPLTKRTGDLQWRILHGVLAVSAFVSVINPNTSRNRVEGRLEMVEFLIEQGANLVSHILCQVSLLRRGSAAIVRSGATARAACSRGRRCRSACSPGRRCRSACTPGRRCRSACTPGRRCRPSCSGGRRCRPSCSRGRRCRPSCSRGRRCRPLNPETPALALNPETPALALNPETPALARNPETPAPKDVAAGPPAAEDVAAGPPAAEDVAAGPRSLFPAPLLTPETPAPLLTPETPAPLLNPETPAPEDVAAGPPAPEDVAAGPPAPVEDAPGPPAPVEDAPGPPAPVEDAPGPPAPQTPALTRVSPALTLTPVTPALTPVTPALTPKQVTPALPAAAQDVAAARPAPQFPARPAPQFPARPAPQFPACSFSASPFVQPPVLPSFVQPHVQSPFVQSPVQSPFVQSPVQSMFQSPVQSPVQSMFQSMFQSPVQSPVQSMFQSPVQSMFQSPVQSLFQSPVQSPVQSLFQSPVQSPVQSLFQSPVQYPVQSPVPSPAQLSVPSPAQLSVPSPAQLSVPSPAQFVPRFRLPDQDAGSAIEQPEGAEGGVHERMGDLEEAESDSEVDSVLSDCLELSEIPASLPGQLALSECTGQPGTSAGMLGLAGYVYPLSEINSFLRVTKALANRLKGVLGSIVHRDQTYYVPDHSIIDNLFLIRDVMELANRVPTDLGLISFDQEKAFDRVDHGYLFNTLSNFGLENTL